MRGREVLKVNTNIVNKLIVVVEIIVIIGNFILGFNKILELLIVKNREM
jgi:hypothetical protein